MTVLFMTVLLMIEASARRVLGHDGLAIGARDQQQFLEHLLQPVPDDIMRRGADATVHGEHAEDVTGDPFLVCVCVCVCVLAGGDLSMPWSVPRGCAGRACVRACRPRHAC